MDYQIRILTSLPVDFNKYIKLQTKIGSHIMKRKWENGRKREGK